MAIVVLGWLVFFGQRDGADGAEGDRGRIAGWLILAQMPGESEGVRYWVIADVSEGGVEW